MGNSTSKVAKIDEAEHAVNSWSNSGNQIDQFTHRWVIDNFDVHLYTPNRDYPRINSPKFSPPNDDTTQFSLRLSPNGENAEEQGKAWIYLFLDCCSKPELRVHFRVSILDKDKSKQNDFPITATFKPNGQGFGNELATRTELLGKLEQWLPGGKLTLHCEIKIISDAVTTSRIKGLSNKKLTDSHIIDNLAELFKTRKLSDVTLVTIGDKAVKTEHRAHKAILGGQSKVFAAMFEHDTKENRESRVEIEDIDSKMIEEMLRFIYTGKVHELGEMADRLLAAADKYALDQLKNQCERYIMVNLNPEKVVDMLLLADKYSAAKLLEKAIKHINDNLPKIMKTDSWKAIKDKPDLYIELFSKNNGGQT